MNNKIYLTSPETYQIFVWKINSQGIMKLIQVVDTPGKGHPIAIHPTKKNLYVGIRPEFGIVNYCINQYGLLKEINTVSLSSSPTYLTISKNKLNLYSVSYSGKNINVFSIDKKGIIDIKIQTIEKLNCCHSANIDFLNNILWVPCLKEDTVRFFNICKSGKLIPHVCKLIRLPLNSGPRHMVFHPNGTNAYLINELNGTINVFDINRLYKIKIIQTINIMPKDFKGTKWSADIHMTPNSKWLYCSDRTANIISCFKICQKNSTLKLINHQTTEHQPRSFTINSTGNYVIVAGQKSNHISVYQIDQCGGKLIYLQRYPAGQNPAWITNI